MNYNNFINLINEDKLEPVYLFLGDEDYLMNKAIDRLKEKYIEQAFETLNYIVIDSRESSFDDILNARRFSSVLYKAQTMYGITPIEDYIPKDAKGQLEESSRIRESILQSEADMWSY